ncbi:Segregation and condensation protein A [Candidatus Bilamarchaeum dharawalense]|uniref:Segregation and condensation protein A n=1 Tax=Candidatus Bilamarchaeum dharawalense TaxID=2885759 RepID=A0A5E4LVR2_9ARCH|nr:Segregation and condensation protein A [Candidatus Bilamarchaeum dharawalense]
MANQMQIQTTQYFESMVSKPTWKDVLLESISSHSIDPWNIDLLQLADAFIKKVREMESMDFGLQANVILAASILLKYKSNYLKFINYQSEISEFMPDGEPDPTAISEIPMLALSSRIPPKRQITLDELIGEMERIIKYDEVERVHIPRGAIMETIDMELTEHDIEKDMDLLLTDIRANTDSEGWSLFSKVTHNSDSRQLIYSLICLLHLVQFGKVDIKQDKLYGEIFIRLLSKSN